MRTSVAWLVIASCLTGLCGRAVAAGEVDELWLQRSTGFEQGRIDPEPTVRVIAALEQRIASGKGGLDARFALLEALYFRGYFLSDSPAEQRALYERMVDLSEESLRMAGSSEPCIAPGCAGGAVHLTRGHFWAAISWGLWGMSHSRLQAGLRDVAGKIRDHASRVIELDPDYADAGGLRLLGRLHTATPRIVLFTGWIDRGLGVELLEQACDTSMRDARNPLFLAEALLRYRPGERERAIELLLDVAGREPRPEFLVEESETIETARHLLESEGVTRR